MISKKLDALFCKISEKYLNRVLHKKISCGKNVKFRKGSFCIKSHLGKVIIGNHGFVSCGFYALNNGEIEIGNNIFIGVGTTIQAKEKVKIGNNVIIANNVIIVDNNNHPISPEMRLKMSDCSDYMKDELWSWKYAESKPIYIEDNVWIGRNSVIMKGVTIGKGSIIALGTIVTKDVPKYCIVAGNPAKIVKRLK